MVLAGDTGVAVVVAGAAAAVVDVRRIPRSRV